MGGTGAGGGAGGDVTVTNTGTIILKGAGSVGVYAQSIGGGGGDAGFSGALNFTGGGELKNTVGGAGKGGDGGNVTVTSTGSIETLGAGSVAVVAQSIGGGGGSGSFAVAAQDGSLDGSALQIGGSMNGTQGANGNVIVNVSGGSIATMGDLSYGLLAQAIGGGGGNGSLIVPDPLTIGSIGVSQVLGASGSIVGDGNPLNVRNANMVTTMGAGAIGVAAQSIGGGGGTSGVTGDTTFTASGPLSIVAGGSTTVGGKGGTAIINDTGASVSTGGGSEHRERRRRRRTARTIDRRRRRKRHLCAGRRNRLGRADLDHARRPGRGRQRRRRFDLFEQRPSLDPGTIRAGSGGADDWRRRRIRRDHRRGRHQRFRACRSSLARPAAPGQARILRTARPGRSEPARS